MYRKYFGSILVVFREKSREWDLSSDDGDFRHGGFGEGVEQLGSMADDASVFLCRSRQETWNIDERDDGDVESVAETHESGAFHRSVDIQTP